VVAPDHLQVKPLKGVPHVGRRQSRAMLQQQSRGVSTLGRVSVAVP